MELLQLVLVVIAIVILIDISRTAYYARKCHGELKRMSETAGETREILFELLQRERKRDGDDPQTGTRDRSKPAPAATAAVR